MAKTRRCRAPAETFKFGPVWISKIIAGKTPNDLPKLKAHAIDLGLLTKAESEFWDEEYTFEDLEDLVRIALLDDLTGPLRGPTVQANSSGFNPSVESESKLDSPEDLTTPLPL